LKAQGLANFFSGLIGGLLIAQVIVRSSTNINFGGRSKLSIILHGFFLFISALLIPQFLNMIPLATLACILLVVGYKLAKPSLFKAMYDLGWKQFVPFVATVAGILFTDLLQGIMIGMIVAVFYILRGHYKNPYILQKNTINDLDVTTINLAEEVSFLNKGSLLKALKNLPKGTNVIIDASGTKHIDHDVIEVIRDFIVNSKNKEILVKVDGLPVLEQVNKENDYQLIIEKDLSHYSEHKN